MEDLHTHKCKDCGHQWTHARNANVPEAVYEAAHTCICGKVEYWIHSRPEGSREALLVEFLNQMIADLEKKDDHAKPS